MSAHNRIVIIILIIAAVIVSFGKNESDLKNDIEKKIISTDNAPRAIGPYSQAVQLGNMLFISGQIGIDPASGNLSATVEDQTRQVMENLNSILKAANMSLQDVVQARIYLTDIDDFQKINGIYASYFEKDFPARSTVEVSGLPRGALVEIEMAAIRSSQRINP